MPAFGVYPIADAQNPGEEISSTYEGRHVTVLESDLIHPTHVGGIVNKGDPVVFGTTGLQGVGVALGGDDNTVAADLIAVDTEGIWNLDVDPTDDLGNSDVAGGDLLYINVTNAVISKISNGATQIPFGIAYGIITAPGVEAIAVKVHFDPSLDNAKRTWYTAPDGIYTFGKHHTTVFEGGQSTGLEYFDQRVGGEQTGGIYGWGSWMEIQASYVSLANQLLVAGEFGIYQGGGDVTNNWIVLEQLQAQLTEAPTRLDLFRVNIAQPVPIVTHCVIAAANPNSVGFVADAVINNANKLGNVPLFDIVGYGVCYVEVFSA